MGVKRRFDEDRDEGRQSLKKSKQANGPAAKKSQLLFEPRPDWHAADLPTLKTSEVTALPPQRTIDDLHKYAEALLESEGKAYNDTHLSGSSSHKFLSTIMSSGTLEDKISALTLSVQESPLHAVRAFENLLGLSKKKSRNQALMALAALKDLLGQGVVLPGDRKLRAFGKQPGLLSALQGKAARWSKGEALPSGIHDHHLLVWAYEDWLKKAYFEILQIMESWLGDEVDYSRSRAITFVYELLRDKPEQEENLLRLLVNKLGDTGRKNASRASYLLLQLETSHPAMKSIITNSIEADCLFRPGQSMHAKYYAIITLNQTVLGPQDQDVANRLLEIYFSVFLQLLKPTEDAAKPQRKQETNQGGGGKPGKLAAKKQREAERAEESQGQLREKLTAAVLTGVNRAFPFADMSDPNFEKQLDTIFRVTHSANFNTAVQALMLIQQISSKKHLGAERFYRTLYESLFDPRLLTSSKQVLYLNLLYKSLKQDLNAKRVQAFVKRLVQIITMHEPPFVCGVLYLISELETTFPSIRNMVKDAEDNDDDGEEHFVDVPEDGAEPVPERPNLTPSITYDPRKRDPEHANADRSCLWDLLPFLQHFHPSVSLFAESLVFNKAMPPKPDPTQHTLMHFLDRFVYRNAKSKSNAGMHGSSIMQPMAGSNAADLLITPGSDETSRVGSQLNSEAFWQKKVEDVAADEVFFHSYFNQPGFQKRKGGAKKKQQQKDEDEDEDSDAGGEDEIWKAITSSRPEVDGPEDDEEDDVDLDELEEAYSDSDDESDAGIDLGGGDDEDATGAVFGQQQELDMDDADEMDGDVLDLESGDEDAMFDSEDDVPMETPSGATEEDDEQEQATNRKKRKDKKKLKSLPTFASVEDYAKLLAGDEDDEDM